MKKIYLILMLALITSGCNGLSPQASKVEVYYLKFRLPAECKKLAYTEVTVNSLMNQDAANNIAKTDLIQKVSDKYHANTLLIDRVGSEFSTVNYQGSASGTAYNCPK